MLPASGSGDHHDTVVVLPIGLTASELSRACRETALQLVNDSHSWGKPELGMWLTGSYAVLARHGRKQDPNALTRIHVPLLREIDARLVERILETARTEVLERLDRIAEDRSASFVLNALISGTVARCEDALGAPAWVPTGSATRLADRVLSLFAVDYLARPGDYESELFVCPQCTHVSFDAVARRRGYCPTHLPNLDARRRLTLPYPPLGA